MRVEDLEQPTRQSPLPEQASVKEQMLHRLNSESGRALCKLRKQTVEPVFGTLKQTLGFRQFLTRGLENVSSEWNLACIAYSLKRLSAPTKAFPSGAIFSTEAKPG